MAAERPIEVLREMRDRLGDLPNQLANVLANQNASRPGFGAPAGGGGAPGSRKRPDRWRAIERLTGAAGAFVPGLSELSSFLRNVREMGEAWDGFWEAFRGKRPKRQAPLTVPRSQQAPPALTALVPSLPRRTWLAGPLPLPVTLVGGFGRGTAAAPGFPPRLPAPRPALPPPAPRRILVAPPPSRALPAPVTSRTPLTVSQPALASLRLLLPPPVTTEQQVVRPVRSAAPAGLFGPATGGAVTPAALTPAMQGFLSLLAELVKETRAMREAYEQNDRNEYDGTDDAERKLGDEQEPARRSMWRREVPEHRSAPAAPRERPPAPQAPFRPARDVPGADDAERGVAGQAFDVVIRQILRRVGGR